MYKVKKMLPMAIFLLGLVTHTQTSTPKAFSLAAPPPAAQLPLIPSPSVQPNVTAVEPLPTAQKMTLSEYFHKRMRLLNQGQVHQRHTLLTPAELARDFNNWESGSDELETTQVYQPVRRRRPRPRSRVRSPSIPTTTTTTSTTTTEASAPQSPMKPLPNAIYSSSLDAIMMNKKPEQSVSGSFGSRRVIPVDWEEELTEWSPPTRRHYGNVPGSDPAMFEGGGGGLDPSFMKRKQKYTPTSSFRRKRPKFHPTSSFFSEERRPEEYEGSFTPSHTQVEVPSPRRFGNFDIDDISYGGDPTHSDGHHPSFGNDAISFGGPPTSLEGPHRNFETDFTLKDHNSYRSFNPKFENGPIAFGGERAVFDGSFRNFEHGADDGSSLENPHRSNHYIQFDSNEPPPNAEGIIPHASPELRWEDGTIINSNDKKFQKLSIRIPEKPRPQGPLDLNRLPFLGPVQFGSLEFGKGVNHQDYKDPSQNFDLNGDKPTVHHPSVEKSSNKFKPDSDDRSGAGFRSSVDTIVTPWDPNDKGDPGKKIEEKYHFNHQDKLENIEDHSLKQKDPTIFYLNDENKHVEDAFVEKSPKVTVIYGPLIEDEHIIEEKSQGNNSKEMIFLGSPGEQIILNSQEKLDHNQVDPYVEHKNQEDFDEYKYLKNYEEDDRSKNHKYDASAEKVDKKAEEKQLESSEKKYHDVSQFRENRRKNNRDHGTSNYKEDGLEGSRNYDILENKEERRKLSRNYDISDDEDREKLSRNYDISDNKEERRKISRNYDTSDNKKHRERLSTNYDMSDSKEDGDKPSKNHDVLDIKGDRRKLSRNYDISRNKEDKRKQSSEYNVLGNVEDNRKQSREYDISGNEEGRKHGREYDISGYMGDRRKDREYDISGNRKNLRKQSREHDNSRNIEDGRRESREYDTSRNKEDRQKPTREYDNSRNKEDIRKPSWEHSAEGRRGDSLENLNSYKGYKLYDHYPKPRDSKEIKASKEAKLRPASRYESKEIAPGKITSVEKPYYTSKFTSKSSEDGAHRRSSSKSPSRGSRSHEVDDLSVHHLAGPPYHDAIPLDVVKALSHEKGPKVFTKIKSRERSKVPSSFDDDDIDDTSVFPYDERPRSNEKDKSSLNLSSGSHETKDPFRRNKEFKKEISGEKHFGKVIEIFPAHVDYTPPSLKPNSVFDEVAFDLNDEFYDGFGRNKQELDFTDGRDSDSKFLSGDDFEDDFGRPPTFDFSFSAERLNDAYLDDDFDPDYSSEDRNIDKYRLAIPRFHTTTSRRRRRRFPRRKHPRDHGRLRPSPVVRAPKPLSPQIPIPGLRAPERIHKVNGLEIYRVPTSTRNKDLIAIKVNEFPPNKDVPQPPNFGQRLQQEPRRSRPGSSFPRANRVQRGRRRGPSFSPRFFGSYSNNIRRSFQEDSTDSVPPSANSDPHSALGSFDNYDYNPEDGGARIDRLKSASFLDVATDNGWGDRNPEGEGRRTDDGMEATGRRNDDRWNMGGLFDVEIPGAIGRNFHRMFG